MKMIIRKISLLMFLSSYSFISFGAWNKTNYPSKKEIYKNTFMKTTYDKLNNTYYASNKWPKVLIVINKDENNTTQILALSPITKTYINKEEKKKVVALEKNKNNNKHEWLEDGKKIDGWNGDYKEQENVTEALENFLSSHDDN